MDDHFSVPDQEDLRPAPADDGDPQEPPSSRDTALSRIAQTGRRVRAEAKRLLAHEAAPRKRSSGRKKYRIPKADLTAALSNEEKGRLIEVTDADDRPLLCMPPETALKHSLCYRLACLALRTRRNSLLLQKNADARLGARNLWDLHTDFVMVGESREDAALRLLDRIQLTGLVPRLLYEAGAHADRRAHYAFFAADLPSGMFPGPMLVQEQPKEKQPFSESASEDENSPELLEVDEDELAGLAGREPELFAPGLLLAFEARVLFRI